jgi:DNA-binding NtrC family response regulator
MIAEKQFREDLYFRISMVEIRTPRLAERKEDLPLLEQHFLARFAKEYDKPLRGLTRRAQTLLSRYGWPGNIRELENVLGNACMMAEEDAIDVHDLLGGMRQSAAAAESPESEEPLTMAEAQYRHARRVLDAMDGNKVQAARALGISRATLYSILGREANGSEEDAAASDASTDG